jgi:4a-hydroxytetrahydrobiopterin dehydratase
MKASAKPEFRHARLVEQRLYLPLESTRCDIERVRDEYFIQRGRTMSTLTSEELVRKSCAPCEGGIPPFSPEAAQAQVVQIEGWSLVGDGKRIRRTWTAKNFMAGIAFFNKVAALAEEEGHHPDLHLEGYRQVAIELWTHAIGGLSENDFILAAKINELPIEVKR